jgi:hypothetical protein
MPGVFGRQLHKDFGWDPGFIGNTPLPTIPNYVKSMKWKYIFVPNTEVHLKQ